MFQSVLQDEIKWGKSSLSGHLLSSDYIVEKQPLTNKFISVPKEYGQLNCAAFIGGIIRGVLDSAEFVRFSVLNVSFLSRSSASVFMRSELHGDDQLVARQEDGVHCQV